VTKHHRHFRRHIGWDEALDKAQNGAEKEAIVAKRIIWEGEHRIFKGPTDAQHDEFVKLGERYLRQAERQLHEGPKGGK
jgi:hypothetical protein